LDTTLAKRIISKEVGALQQLIEKIVEKTTPNKIIDINLLKRSTKKELSKVNVPTD